MTSSNGTPMERPDSSAPSDPRSGFSPLDDEACEWVERFVQGRGNHADIARLRRWMARSPAHAEAFDRIGRIWTSLGPVGQALAAKGLVSPRSRYPARTAMLGPSGAGRRAFIGGALAASAAGAAAVAVRPPLGLWPSWSELTADYRTNPGERRQVVLDQQIAIDLNTRSSLALLPAGNEVQLIAGEALISSPPHVTTLFTLQAGEGRIVATNGRFNVRIDGQAVCVTCVTGGVRVEQRTWTVPLSAGQQVNYSGREIGQPVSVDLASVTAWQEGVLVFEATPIAKVIEEVNRYRPGRIVLTNAALGRRLFDARLRIENVGYVVRQIELAFGARATALPGGIVLLG